MRFFAVSFLLLLLQSCHQDYSKHGKVSIYQSSSKSKAFLFKVEGEFSASNSSSESDKNHKFLSKAEVGLLNDLLVNESLCLDEFHHPSYVITSKQEKIYDITFANLIEQSYNARPVSPLTYFGKCLQ